MKDLDGRREEVLVNVQREARAAAGRRRVVRRGGGVVCAALVVGAFVRLVPTGSVPVVPGPVAGGDPRIVETRADLASYVISDDELVAALEATGKSFTLMWVDGEARLVEPVEEGDGGAV